MSVRIEGFNANFTAVSILGPTDDDDILSGQHGIALSDDSTALFIGTPQALRSLAQRFLIAAQSLEA